MTAVKEAEAAGALSREGTTAAIVSCEAAIADVSASGRTEPDGATLIAAMRRSQLLQAFIPTEGPPRGAAEPAVLLEALIALGRANLSAGRLFEGHVNALKLIGLYGSEAQRQKWFAAARQGALFGVWGADGVPPVRLEAAKDEAVHLSGQKLYASGADVMDVALVTARDADDETVLVVLPRITLTGRLHPEEWPVSGMRATASGRCDLRDFASAQAEVLGAAGDYFREPYFQGGVWRYAAVHLGGMYALTRAALDQLQARRQLDAPLQSMRLRRMIAACETVRLWLRAAADEVEAPHAGPAAAEAAIFARLKAVEEATTVMALVDEALGAASFLTTHPAERVRRDLQFYLRQADPDGMGQGAMQRVLADPEQRARWGLE